MAIKSAIFIFGVLVAFGGAVFVHPFIGLCGYLLSYNINPIGFWWGKQLPEIFQRYSMIFFLACFSGMALHWGKLRFRNLVERQEILMGLYILVIWLSTLTGVPTETLGFNSMKMTKIFLILMLASHLVTQLKFFNIMIWIYMISALISGVEIYSADYLTYFGGRLQSGVGGSDFAEGNFLAVHYVMVLPWLGISFVKGGIKTKSFCAIAGVFIVNTLILIESRGAFLALGAGTLFVLLTAGRKLRTQIIVLLIIGAGGFVYLSDTSFWDRMNTLETSQSEMDSSATGRIEAWSAAIEMVRDYPYGVGEGNFKALIGLYNPDAAGRDTHNTFFRCLAELGIQGLSILFLMIYTAHGYIRQIQTHLDLSTPLGQEYNLHTLALRTGLVMYLVGTCFLSHTYVEEFYWVLMFPLFLKRCYENEF